MARVVRHEATGPIKVEPQEKPVWVCGCGISKTFPFCDGSHKICRTEEAGFIYVYDPATQQVVEKRAEGPADRPPGGAGV